MTPSVAIHWFRHDFRLADNPALTSAAQYHTVYPIYILNTTQPPSVSPGGATRWWCHHSLASLHASLDETLSFYIGDPLTIILHQIESLSVQAVCWNDSHEPWQMAQDHRIKTELQARGITVHTHNASLLWHPSSIKKNDGTHYKVFTPFYNNGCTPIAPRNPLPAPSFIRLERDATSKTTLEDLRLLPTASWSTDLGLHWTVGESQAHQRFDAFILNGLNGYHGGRDYPAQPHVSRLSPHLHFGELSPHFVWHRLRRERQATNGDHVDHFCRELGWREFSYYQLHYFPDLPTTPLNPNFDRFPWAHDDHALTCWQQGQTGIPIVDAGMRELWQTGYMHNRVRMITASFLVKNLRLHWHHGERWFWDTLVDADLASNSASWQWVAGCGADAAPYFRIFNPIIQSQKFDPNGDYIRQWVPEIAALPNRHLFSPWDAPHSILDASGIRIGHTYPSPLVDLRESRQAALAAFHSLKKPS